MTSANAVPADHHRDDQASQWCLRFAEGGLSPQEQIAFNAWLDEAPANAARFDDAVGVWRALEQASVSPELLTLRRGALDRFDRAQRRRWRESPRLRLIVGSIAAAILVGLFSLGLLFAQMPKVYETGQGERRVVVLADGSSASLDAATRLEVRFRGDRRDLVLKQGRAKFDVARDPLRPFSVLAADKVVVATGTEFSVELLDRSVQVILYEGHVAVLETPEDAPTRAVVLPATGKPADQSLTPGRELTLPVGAAVATAAGAPSAASAAPELRETDPARALSWEGGQLVFVDEPLANAVERVNRYGPIRIEVSGLAAGQRVDGVYAAGDTEAFVEGVTGVLPVEAERQGNTVLLRQR